MLAADQPVYNSQFQTYSKYDSDSDSASNSELGSETGSSISAITSTDTDTGIDRDRDIQIETATDSELLSHSPLSHSNSGDEWSLSEDDRPLIDYVQRQTCSYAYSCPPPSNHLSFHHTGTTACSHNASCYCGFLPPTHTIYTPQPYPPHESAPMISDPQYSAHPPTYPTTKQHFNIYASRLQYPTKEFIKNGPSRSYCPTQKSFHEYVAPYEHQRNGRNVPVQSGPLVDQCFGKFIPPVPAPDQGRTVDFDWPMRGGRGRDSVLG